MAFEIFTDTAANLDTELKNKYGIVDIPLTYSISDTEYICNSPEKFDDAEYYSKIKDGVKVTTSQINPQSYIEYMKPVLEKGNDVLFIGVSSGISGSFSSAKIAKEQLIDEFPERKIELVDSLGASLGEGLLVLRAAKCRENGMNLEDTAKRITGIRSKIYQFFFVDDLMHLKRTGRLSGGMAIVGSVLGIKPLLKGDENGKIVACGKARGRKQAIKALAEKYIHLAKDTCNQIIGISYANCKEDAEYLKKLILEALPCKEVLLQKHEPVTGSHLGPGALALYFEGDSNVRFK